MNLEEYTQYHETKLHEQPGFSYNTYLCTIPLDFPRVDLHWHEQMEIIYVKKGAGTVYVGTTSCPVSAGSIVPVFPGELHGIEGPSAASGEKMEYENIIFSLSILDSTEENDWCRTNVLNLLMNGRLNFDRPINPGSDFYKEAAFALDSADRACEHRESGYSLVVKSALFMFLHSLYSNRIRGEERVQSQHEETIKKVIMFVRENFSEPITVSDAAAVTEYSSAHFMRFFKQETGRTFIEYLTDYRLGFASYLLKESSDPISVIAGKCGFDNFSYFIRVFKRRYGVPPGRYRSGK